jgi:hypothetical protein
LIVSASRVPKLQQHRKLPRGCALAIVTLTDVIEVEPKTFYWLLSNPRLFPSIPVKGKRRIWTV